MGAHSPRQARQVTGCLTSPPSRQPHTNPTDAAVRRRPSLSAQAADQQVCTRTDPCGPFQAASHAENAGSILVARSLA